MNNSRRISALHRERAGITDFRKNFNRFGIARFIHKSLDTVQLLQGITDRFEVGRWRRNQHHYREVRAQSLGSRVSNISSSFRDDLRQICHSEEINRMNIESIKMQYYLFSHAEYGSYPYAVVLTFLVYQIPRR
mmetsp:Transcript_21069/g.47795  ORF Transcript_21069/g.47795 Transcript_21069/m.47795 type:complete len:134 (+) Transcript_21069:362-763(+)